MMSEIAGAASAASEVEFRANRADLGCFVDQGRTYVQKLEAIMERLHRQRLMAVDLFGPGVGPIDQATRPLQELVAEATINNAFVEEIRSALESSDIRAGNPLVATAGIARRLVATQLELSGIDRSLESDLAKVREFRTRRLGDAGLASAAIDRFVGHSAVTDAALALLDRGVHPTVVASGEFDRLLDVAAFVADAQNADFDLPQIEALVTRAYAPGLDHLVMTGRAAPPTDAIRERVVAAMVAGLGPIDVQLAPAYFPAGYRRFLDLEQEMAALETEREAADGSWWSFWDGDQDRLDVIAAERAELEKERDGLIQRFDLRHGLAGRFAAVAAISITTGGGSWEGETYAFHFNGHHDGKVSDPWWDPRGPVLEHLGGNAVELAHIGMRVSTDPAVATAFFNGIGVDRTANLPTFLVADNLEGEAFDRFGVGLAGASQQMTAAGRPALTFSGSDLIRDPKPRTEDRLIWYSPALLFATGEFEPRFLADAAGSSLYLAEEGQQQGLHTHLGQDMLPHLPGLEVVRFDGGEDPRNILLARVAENPSAVRSMIRSMGGPEGRAWPGIPTAGRLDPLLKPRVPFGPALEPQGNPTLIDRLWSRGLFDRSHRVTTSSVARPELSSEYPITNLLGAVADHDDLSRWLLLYAANSADSERPMVKDPGTAAGLDLIMAKHATIMFDPGDLSAVGIEPTSLNRDAPITVGAEQWRTVHGEVLRYGRGQALAASADGLLNESIIGAIDGEGRFDSGKTKRFAHVAARTEAEAYEALFAYAAQLDDEARARNRKANLAASSVFAVAGLTPGVVPTVGASVAGVGWAALYDGDPTDAELENLRATWRDEYYNSDLAEWRKRIASAALEAKFRGRIDPRPQQMTVMVPNVGPAEVQIERERQGAMVKYLWQHPVSLEWSEIPEPSAVEFDELFPAVVDGAISLHRATVNEASAVGSSYYDGLLMVDSSRESSRAEVEDAVRAAGWTEIWIDGD